MLNDPDVDGSWICRVLVDMDSWLSCCIVGSPDTVFAILQAEQAAEAKRQQMHAGLAEFEGRVVTLTSQLHDAQELALRQEILDGHLHM